MTFRTVELGGERGHVDSITVEDCSQNSTLTLTMFVQSTVSH